MRVRVRRTTLVGVSLVFAGIVQGAVAAELPNASQGPGQQRRGARASDPGVRTILERVARDPQRLAEAARELERLGPSSRDALFVELEAALAGPAGLSSGRPEVVLDLFRALPPEETRAFVRSRGGADSTPTSSRAALVLYGEFGQAADCGRLLRDLIEPEHEPEVGRELERALARILVRDGSRAHDQLHAKLRDTDPVLYPYVARALGAANSPKGLRSLTRMLGIEDAADEVVLLQIARLARSAAAPFEERTVEKVRGFLAADDERVRAAAAVAVGGLRDHEAVGILIELVEQDGPAARQAAHAALERVTGLGFRADHRLWRAWQLQELSWWEHDAAAAFDGLDSDDLARVIASIGAISGRRLFRRDLVRELAPLLEHRDARVRQLACIGLGQLGSVTAIPLLDACLADRDELVRKRARSAIDLLGREEPATDS